MAWDDAPPSKTELASPAWDATPPTKEEVASHGLVDRALEKVAAVGKAVDSYTGAPTRAAIAAVQHGNSPIDAFKKQFGENPETAPTGHQIAVDAGVSDKAAPALSAEQMKQFDAQNNPGVAADMKARGQAYQDQPNPSPAAVTGMGIDFAADPTNLIPIAGEARAWLKGGEEAAKGATAVSKFSLADKLKDFAEKTAVNATGATGKQASQFAENAGRELLDRGVVRFGDSQGKIAKRAAQAVEEANSKIDTALKKLTEQGVTVDRNTIYNTTRDVINEMKADESKADVAKLLEGHLDNVVSAADAGGAKVPIAKAEEIKRGYNRVAGNWADPEKGLAGKQMYQTYRGAVEDAARAADPTTAAAFEEGKKSHGLMAPIQEAAERRASTTGQHQHGGLIDVVAAEVGEKALGPAGMVITPVARRVIMPRVASSLAVTADKTADLLRKMPQFADMEAKNPALFTSVVTHLSNSNLSPMSKAADQAPQKGPDKWANDGLNRLLEHAPAGDRELIGSNLDGLLNSKTAKKLLISASDLKPGSKAMENVLGKVKAELAKTGGAQ